MIFGAPCIGKSLLANNLAERLNISNVLQTDIVEMVMKSMESKYFESLSSISEFDGNEDKFVLNFRKVLYHKINRAAESFAKEYPLTSPSVSAKAKQSSLKDLLHSPIITSSKSTISISYLSHPMTLIRSK